MRKQAAPILFILCILNTAFAATGRGLQVRAAGEEVFNVKPKQIITTSFRITNDTDRTHEIIIEPDLPDDWHLVTDYFPFLLGSGQELVRYMSVFVPESTLPGRYQITFRARSRKDLSLSDFYTIDVNVKSDSNVTIDVIHKPKYVTLNHDYQAKFKITNTGNTEQKIALTIRSEHSFPVVLDESMVVLGPGRSKTITATARVLDNIDNILHHDLVLSAQPISKDVSKQKVSVLCTSQVIPATMDIPQQPTRGAEQQTMLAESKTKTKTHISTLKPADEQHEAVELHTVISSDEDVPLSREQLIPDSKEKKPQSLIIFDAAAKQKALVDGAVPAPNVPLEAQTKKKSYPPISADARPPSSQGYVLRRAAAREFIETRPRQVITSVFNVSNPSGVERQFAAELKLPEGWNQVVPLLPFYLEPGRTSTKLVNIFVPQTAFAGEYDFTFIVYDIKEPSFRDSISTRVNVLTVSDLQIEMLEAPDFVIAGEKYQVKFLVTNKSNKRYTIQTSLLSNHDIPAQIRKTEFKLEPGQSQMVTASAQTIEDITRDFKHRIILTAEAFEDGESVIQSRHSSLVDVTPRISDKQDPYHTLPSEVILRYVYEDNRESDSGFQTTIQGRGTLDEKGTRHVEFKFQGPDIQDKSILGERDEYYFSTWTDTYKLHFGDRSYALSPLTENYLYGRGAEGQLKLTDELSVKAYHMRTRWLSPKVEETAGRIDYRFDEDNRFGFNILRKTRGSETDDIFSVHTQLEPFPRTDLELEYAVGPGAKYRDNAHLARLYGRNSAFNYYLKWIHAGPDYPGYYRDQDYMSAGINVPVTGKLRLNASVRREKQNLDKNTNLFSAPLEMYYQFGLDYQLPAETTLSFDYRRRDREDRLPLSNYDYRENTLRLGLNKGFKKLSFNTTAEFGETDNYLTDRTSELRKYTLSAYYRPDSKQTYGGYLYIDEDSSYMGNEERSITYGLNAEYRFSKRTSLRLTAQADDFRSSMHNDRDYYQARFAHTFRNENEISLFARHTCYKTGGFDDETSLMLQYRIPIGIPLVKKTSIGSLQGTVLDTKTKAPYNNCIITLNGLTAVTDSSGSFIFPSVRPGNYYLNVDTARLDAKRIPDMKAPIEVSINSADMSLIDIPLVEPAFLSGDLFVYGYEGREMVSGRSDKTGPRFVVEGSDEDRQPKTLVKEKPFPNAVVEIKGKDGELKRTVTDRKGSFIFHEIRPGTWTLTVHARNLPDYHKLETTTFQFDLLPGGTKEISARIIPQKRTIRIISAPQTVIEEAAD